MYDNLVSDTVPIALHEGEGHAVGYWVDLKGMNFDDDTVVSDGETWLQALPLGQYEHPIHGQLDITPEKVETLVANFNNRVREQDIDIDYDHKIHSGDAAGWVKQAESRPDGLWIKVKWTEPALKKLRDKAYRYFSPEYVDRWRHPKTGQTFEHVLFGGALTNRPFLKDIMPINLSEVVRASEGGSLVDPKQLRQLLGLAEGATDEEVTAKLAQLVAGTSNGGDPPKDEEKPSSDPPKTEEPTHPEPVLAQLSETQLQAEAAKNPVVAILLAERAETKRKEEADRKQLTELMATVRLSEVTDQVRKLDEGQSYAIPPAVKEKLIKSAVVWPKQLSDQVINLVGDLVKGGVVPLGEIGGADPGTQNGDDTKRFAEMIAKRMETTKESYSDAVVALAATEEGAKLYEVYRRNAWQQPGASQEVRG